MADVQKLNGTVPLEKNHPLRADDLAARLLPIGEGFSVITDLSDGTATVPLDPPDATTLFAFGNLPRTAAVVTPMAEGSNELQVDNADPFAEGDLVAHVQDGAAVSDPVSITKVGKDGKLVLRSPLPDLKAGDTIAAADFRVRATVQEVHGKTLTVAQAAIFPAGGFVASLDEDLRPRGVAMVGRPAGTSLILEDAIAGLTAGDVIGLCAFPSPVLVELIDPDGRITVSGRNPPRPGDVVAARGCMALVAGAAGAQIRLASAIPGLAANDSLDVATVRGAVDVTRAGAGKVTVEPASPLRKTDFLAQIVGWRMASPGGVASVAQVVRRSNTNVRLQTILDGLLPNDIVGWSDLVPPAFLLRLNDLPGLASGDEVQLAAPDRRSGKPISLLGRIYVLKSGKNQIVVFVENAREAFSLRPGDVAASVLFVRGSALPLIQKLDLFVSWLACADPDAMPRPCVGVDPPGCPCAPIEE